MQNYQQVVGQIGGTSGGKMITPEEAVVLIDDLEATAPSIHQHYTDEIALAVRSALTDAELFISYNMPAKALGPLVGALPLAPNDLRLNQRLAALHTRAGRFAEAALCCRTLQTVYSDADHPDEATRYGELAERYEERSSAPAPAAPVEDSHIFLDAAPQVAEPAAETVSEHTPEPESAVPEFAIDEVPAEEPASQPEKALRAKLLLHLRRLRLGPPPSRNFQLRLPPSPLQPPKSISLPSGMTQSPSRATLQRLKQSSRLRLRRSSPLRQSQATKYPTLARPMRRSKKFASISLMACPSRPWRPWLNSRR